MESPDGKLMGVLIRIRTNTPVTMNSCYHDKILCMIKIMIKSVEPSLSVIYRRVNSTAISPGTLNCAIGTNPSCPQDTGSIPHFAGSLIKMMRTYRIYGKLTSDIGKQA